MNEIRKAKRAQAFLSKSSVVIILALAIIIFAVLTGGKSIRVSNIINILQQATSTGLMTIGMTLVILDRGIDLSVGGIAALSSAIGAKMMTEWGFDWGFSCVVMVLIGILIGAINGLTIAKLRVTPFICTMAMLKITQGFAHYILNGKTIFGLPDQHVVFGQSDFLGIPVSVWILAIFAVVGILLLRYSYFGRELYAMGGNPVAAWIAGVNVSRNRILVYMISGFCCGCSALIITSRIMCAQVSIGEGSELDAIAGAVIGGVSMSGGEGGVLGAVIGTLVIVMINNGLNLLAVSPFIQTAVKGLVIYVAVTMDALQRRRSMQAVG